MPRSYDDYPDLTRMFYEPELDTLYERDFRDACEEARRERALGDRESLEEFIRDAWEFDRAEQEEIRANLVDNPELQARFNAILAGFEDQMNEFRGRLEVKDSTVPGYRDIHLYVESLWLDNALLPNFLRDLASTAELVTIEPHPEGIHARFGIPYYDYGD